MSNPPHWWGLAFGIRFVILRLVANVKYATLTDHLTAAFADRNNRNLA
jgi:hypothetical protein